MPPEHLPPDDPREWLRRSASDLALAGSVQQGVCLEDLCFHVQQAAEKALKALLIGRQIDFPYTHDLARLLGLLEQAGERLPDSVRQAAGLTRFAVLTRYPGLEQPVSSSEYVQALAQAEAVCGWVEDRLQSLT